MFPDQLSGFWINLGFSCISVKGIGSRAQPSLCDPFLLIVNK